MTESAIPIAAEVRGGCDCRHDFRPAVIAVAGLAQILSLRIVAA